ncbi:sodium-dependent transporter [Aliidiomarina halalkaliphila]|uniref:Sodium-dependent transporter n=1 Tax=Aliidiomarina halalkaliphila TaxID=2593535 RepID=A0A552WYT2_9GAMM|nr:sodium-dependent transporter [Aliidiomarina halalkaliphila]TRW47981.1 sodium-dependent transporter [Aliidiomarina halalkaliphila]
MSTAREHFSSRIGFILAAAGSAVGIGNMVGFPVAATKNGGGAFLLIYALFVVFICLPIMLAEMGLGRRTQSDPHGAYIAIAGAKHPWRFAGWLAVITPFMIGVFYMVITVWILGYLVQTLFGNLDVIANPEYFGVFINHGSVFAYLLMVAAIVYMVLVSGVRGGIERAARLMMPALFVMLIALVIFVLTLDNAFAGVQFFLIPDFSKVDGGVISGALSQAFFSLSLGMGILITYGSYLRQKDNLVGASKLVLITDTAVAFTAGLMVLPAIFAINPDTNPAELSESSVAMIFTFLPQIFLALSGTIGYLGASIVAVIFFLLVFVAAITSLVSIIEVPTATIVRKYNITRQKALGVLALTMGVLTLIATASFGMVAFFTDFVGYGGNRHSFFDVIYDVFYDTVLPLNGLLICLFVVWHWKKNNFHDALNEGAVKYRGGLLEKYVSFSLTTFIPAILAIVFINTVLGKFFNAAFF